MRILVHEFATGGGMAGDEVGESLACEGRAMRDALVEDLAAAGHRVLVSLDARFGFSPGAAVVAKTMPDSAMDYGAALDRLIDQVDAVWLIAPETGGRHEDIARRVERRRKPLLGSGSDSIGRASDKGGLAELMTRQGIPFPATVSLPLKKDPGTVARSLAGLTFPVVVKPRRGAGSEGVRLYHDMVTLLEDLNGLPLDGLAQEHVRGIAVSVSLLADGHDTLLVALNSQELEGSQIGGVFRYRGGTTPFDHPDADLAVELARSACRLVSGLRGYVGVDLVMGPWGPVVIEINPRLTTAYLGLRATIEGNLAALAIDAVLGVLPAPIGSTRCVRFSEVGEILSSEPLRACS